MQRTLPDGSYASYDADQSEGVYPVTGLERPEVSIEDLERLLRPVSVPIEDEPPQPVRSARCCTDGMVCICNIRTCTCTCDGCPACPAD